MKVVHINASDFGGGAAIAATRHCESMTRNGIQSTMLTVEKSGYKQYVVKLHLGVRAMLPLVFRILHERILNRLNSIGAYSVMKYGHPFHRNKYVKEADIIFLHWVNGDTLSIKGVEKILKLGKPTYWYMHDMFPITGGCHHSLKCYGYQSDCRNCPLIQNEKFKSVSSKQLTEKIKHWSKYSNLKFITPSKWLCHCVEQSTIGKKHKVFVVPNVIDTELFKPLPFDTKVVFGLDPNKRTILFSADLSGSVYKGSEYTIECFKKLDPEKYEGLIIGNMPRGIQEIIPMKIVSTGYLMDALSLVIAYNACDTFIISSIAENYPNVVMEAMACGKPCIGYTTGGIPDLIKHKKTGFLSKANSVAELIDGINYLFEDKELYLHLSKESREQILINNSYDKVRDIYHDISLI